MASTHLEPALYLSPIPCGVGGAQDASARAPSTLTFWHRQGGGMRRPIVRKAPSSVSLRPPQPSSAFRSLTIMLLMRFDFSQKLEMA
jgi:hypothetical protein